MFMLLPYKQICQVYRTAQQFPQCLTIYMCCIALILRGGSGAKRWAKIVPITANPSTAGGGGLLCKEKIYICVSAVDSCSIVFI